MLTIDSSVHVSGIVLREPKSRESVHLLDRLKDGTIRVVAPTLVLTEVAASVARITNSATEGLSAAYAMRVFPGHVLVPIDESLADEAAALAVSCRLRGADAIFAAVALRYRTTLVTLDREQLERLSSVIPVVTPSGAIALLDGHHTECDR